MLNLSELMRTMVQRSIRFTRNGTTHVRVEGPQGSLTPEVTIALRQHRDVLAQILGLPSADGPKEANSMTTYQPSSIPSNETFTTHPNVRDGSSPAYHLVNRAELFGCFLRQLARQPRFAFDLETTGLDPAVDRIVGWAFSWQSGEGWYLPVQSPPGTPHLDYDATLAQLKPVLEDVNLAKVNQNIKFDLQVLRHHGIQVAGVQGDPMVADYLLRAGEHGHSLDEIARRYLGQGKTPITDLIGEKNRRKKSPCSMAEVPLEQITAYAAADADLAFRLSHLLEDRLRFEGLGDLYTALEVPLVTVLADMEATGIRLDVSRLEHVGRELTVKLTALELEIFRLAGRQFNLNSTPQLRQVLFDKMKLPVTQRTASGAASTDAEALASLSGMGYELPKLLSEHRTLAKLKSTYVDALPRLVHPVTGRVHTLFNQTVTATGRLSSSRPNLQNIPTRSEQGRQVRQAFLPAQGWLLLKSDYSQIELRILAHYSGDAELRRAYQEDRDIHTLVARQCFRVPESEVTADQRRFAKTINFGVIYGMSAHGLAKKLQISQEEASSFIDAYFARYPAVAGYQDELLCQCRRLGYVSTLLGRRRYLSGIRSDTNYRERNRPEREAINMQVQGSAADLLKLAMVRVHRRLQREQRSARMLLTVHDELVLEVPPMELTAVAVLVKEEMEEALTLTVPLKVELAAGPNWLDMKMV